MPTPQTLFRIGMLAVILTQPVGAETGPRGPVPFSVHDLDGDGYITRAEFDDFRARRQAERAAEGRHLRNVPRLLSFDEIDVNRDGRIDEAEMLDAVHRHRHGRPGPAP